MNYWSKKNHETMPGRKKREKEGLEREKQRKKERKGIRQLSTAQCAYVSIQF
jgi:hypothetical protein